MQNITNNVTIPIIKKRYPPVKTNPKMDKIITNLDNLFKKIKVLLTEQPNLSQPLNSVALTLFKKSVGYSEKVRSYVEEHAISSL